MKKLFAKKLESHRFSSIDCDVSWAQDMFDNKYTTSW